MEELSFFVPVRPPFSFDQALTYLLGSPARIVERIDDHSYHRPLRLGGKPVVLKIEVADPKASALRCVIRGGSLHADLEPAAREIVTRTFGTDDDLGPLLEHAPELDPFGQQLLQAFRGVRPVLLPDLFETITWAIIGQQINVIFAAKCKRAFVERFGESFTLGGEAWLLFSTPERVADISESELAAIQFDRQKTRYVLNLAREIVEGKFDLDALLHLPRDEALERLERLTGIGRWTAEYVLMRGIGHRDVIPAADGGLRRIIGQRYDLGRLASEAEVRMVAEQWAGWRSYFAFYLWFTLQEEERARRAARAQSVRRLARE